MSDLYVSHLGNDITGTGSKENPYATLPVSISNAKANDTVWMLSNLLITAPIYLTKSITLRSYGNEKYTLEMRGQKGINSRIVIGVDDTASFTGINVIFYKSIQDNYCVGEFFAYSAINTESFPTAMAGTVNVYNCVFNREAISFRDIAIHVRAVNIYNCVINFSSTDLDWFKGSRNYVNCATIYTSFPGNTTTTSLVGCLFDSDYNIINKDGLWKHQGTGFNNDGSKANIGLYGGMYYQCDKYLLKDNEGYKKCTMEKGAPIKYADGTLTTSTNTSTYKIPEFSGVSAGKWYWEYRLLYDSHTHIGITLLNDTNNMLTLYGSQIYVRRIVVLDDRLVS